MQSPFALNALLDKPTMNFKSLQDLMILILNTYITVTRCDSEGELQGKYKAKRYVQSVTAFWTTDNTLLEKELSMMLKPHQKAHLKYFSKGEAEIISANSYFSAWNVLAAINIDTAIAQLTTIVNQLKEGTELKKIIDTCMFHLTQCLDLIKKTCQEFTVKNKKNKEYIRFLGLQQDLFKDGNNWKEQLNKAKTNKREGLVKVANYIDANLDTLLIGRVIDQQLEWLMFGLREQNHDIQDLIEMKSVYDAKNQEYEELKKRWPTIESDTSYLSKQLYYSFLKIQTAGRVDGSDISNLNGLDGYNGLINKINADVDDYCAACTKEINEQISLHQPVILRR